MTTQPTPVSTEPIRDHQWVADASPEEIRDLMRTLARSPHAEIALSHLFNQARVVGAYYTWTDMDSRACDLRDSIEDRLKRTLTDDEFDTLVEGAWARFAAPGGPHFAYEALREGLFAALWDQVEAFTAPVAPQDTAQGVPLTEPNQAPRDTVEPPTPPVATRWVLSASELAEVRLTVALVNASFDGDRVVTLTAEQAAGQSPGVGQDQFETVLTGDREVVHAAAFEVTETLQLHEPGRWPIATVLTYTCAVIAECGWTPDTRQPEPPPTWRLVDHLLNGASNRNPRLDPATADELAGRVLPRLDAAIQTADRMLADLWRHRGRTARPVTTPSPARTPKSKRLYRALGNREVPRAWLPQVVDAWVVWRALPTTQAAAAPQSSESRPADWERIPPPAGRPPAAPPAAGSARPPVGI